MKEGRSSALATHQSSVQIRVQAVLLKGERLLVPALLRKEMLIKLHSCHLRAEKVKQRARVILFLSMVNDRMVLVMDCYLCSSFHREQTEYHRIIKSQSNPAKAKRQLISTRQRN